MSKQLTLGILAHVDAGKTTLSEAMLYTSGTIRKLGRSGGGGARPPPSSRTIMRLKKIAELPFSQSRPD